MAVRTRERGYKGCVLGRFQEHEVNKNKKKKNYTQLYNNCRIHISKNN